VVLAMCMLEIVGHNGMSMDMWEEYWHV